MGGIHGEDLAYANVFEVFVHDVNDVTAWLHVLRAPADNTRGHKSLAGGAPFPFFAKETAKARPIAVGVGQDIQRGPRLKRVLGIVEGCQARAADEIVSMDARECYFRHRVEEPGAVTLELRHAKGAAERALARAVATDGFAVLGVLPEDYVADLESALRAASILKLGTATAVCAPFSKDAEAQFGKDLELRTSNVRHSFGRGQLKRNEFTRQRAGDRPVHNKVARRDARSCWTVP